MPGFHYLTPTFNRKRKPVIQVHSSPASRSHSPEPREDYQNTVDSGNTQNLLSVPSLTLIESTFEDAASVTDPEKNDLSRSLEGARTTGGQVTENSDKSPCLPPKHLEPPRTASPYDASADRNSDEEAVDRCSGHDHFSIQVIDERLNISVDSVFAHCFTDSSLYRDCVAAKKTFDVILNPWPDEPDANGTKVRNISYTLSLNYAVGPKVSPSTERQIMYPESKSGQFYLIDTECINAGIPYGENFYIINRFCISKISSHRSHLRITSQIRYRKSVWGLIKNFIEKNAAAGIIDSFNVLANLLRQLSDSDQIQMPASASEPCNFARKRVLRRKRTAASWSKNAPGDFSAPSTSRLVSTSIRQRLLKAAATKIRDEWHIRLTFGVIVRIVCVALLFLFVFNVVIFYKLSTLEASTARLSSVRLTARYDSSSVNKESPTSNLDWMHLLDEQRLIHESEISHWKEILSASIKLLDQMTQTLTELRSNLDQRSIYQQDYGPDFNTDAS